MPYNHEWQSRIKAVEREYVAMRQAADRFRQAALDDPTILQENLRHGEIVVASKNLEGTYIIRLFAEFETVSRLPDSLSPQLAAANAKQEGQGSVDSARFSKGMQIETTTRQDVKTVVRQAFQPDSERDTVRLESLTYLIFWRVVEKKNDPAGRNRRGRGKASK